jgi:hypothetical protein
MRISDACIFVENNTPIIVYICICILHYDGRDMAATVPLHKFENAAIYKNI